MTTSEKIEKIRLAIEQETRKTCQAELNGKYVRFWFDTETRTCLTQEIDTLFIDLLPIQEPSPETDKWVSVETELPTIAKHGKKVLLWREMNESQKEMNITVHETLMVKYCEKTTLWQPLPPLPSPPNKPTDKNVKDFNDITDPVRF